MDSLPAMREIFREEVEEATRREVEGVARLVAEGALDEEGEENEGCKPISWNQEEEEVGVRLRPFESTQGAAAAAVTPTKAFLPPPPEDEDSQGSNFSLPVTPPASDSKKAGSKRRRLNSEGNEVEGGGAAKAPKPCFKNLAVSFPPSYPGTRFNICLIIFPFFQANFDAVGKGASQNGVGSPPVFAAAAAEVPAALANAADQGESEELQWSNEITPDKRIPAFRHPPPAPKRPSESQQTYFLKEISSFNQCLFFPERVAPSKSSSGRTVAARKRLDFSGPPSLRSPRGFSLPHLHRHVLGRDPRGAHSAEEDCMALMRVCAAKRSAFGRRLAADALPFAEGGKMW